MAFNQGKKWLNLVFLAYLALAVTVSFTCSTRDNYYFDDSYADGLDTGSFFPLNDLAVDCLAEYTPARGKTNPYQLRNGLLRVFALAGMCITAKIFLRSHYCVLYNDKKFAQKNNILLKLRI